MWRAKKREKKRKGLILGGLEGGFWRRGEGRRTFGAEKLTGLEDTWMRSFFLIVVGGIFHFDDINIFFPRCCRLFSFFPRCCLFSFVFFLDNRRYCCSSNTRRRRKSNFNRFSLTTNSFDGMFQDLRNELEREVEEAERFGGCLGEGSGSGGARFGGRSGRWRCGSCGCIGGCIGRGRLCRRRHFLNRRLERSE